jgi:short-subunit dehydrogenase
MGSWFSKEKSPKVVLITGASAGIGKDAAKLLIERGHIVYGAARRVTHMQDLVDLGGHALEMDVTDEAQVKEGIKKIYKDQGKIDVLVNNAGYGCYGSVEDISMQDARNEMDVNLFGLAFATKQVIPHMRTQKSGTIINISSVGGKIYTPFGAWYHASKAALEGFSDCLRLELKQFNVNVVVVEPGGIETEFGDVLVQPLVERSKGGPYENAVGAFVKNFGHVSLSPAMTVAKKIATAVEAKYPKRRYVVGLDAKFLMFIRSWFGDTVFDFIMLSMMK